MTTETLILTILYLIILIPFFYLAFAALSFAPWVPCWKKDLERIFKLADLKAGEVFYDLGCGDGKTVIFAAKNFKAMATGLEISIPMYLICKLKQILKKNKNIKFKYKNLFKEDLSMADVVYFFGLENTISKKLSGKLEKELKPGARVISYVFPVKGWTPNIVDKPSKKENSIFLYII